MRYVRIGWKWALGVLLVGYVAVAWVYASGAISGLVLKNDIPDIDGVSPEPVTLVNGDIELDAGFYSNPTQAGCAVVLVHGIDDDRASVIPYAPLYWELGCDVFAFDHRDHGRSTPAHRTYGFHESADTALAIDWVADRTGLESSRIGLHGVSMGAATAIEVLDRRDDLAFVVADSPYSSMGEIVSATAHDTLSIGEPLLRPLAFLFIELRADMQVGKVDPSEAVVGKGTPILLMHTDGDEIVPVAHTEKIALANPAVVRHVLQADGIHLHAYQVRPAAYTAIVHEFIEAKAPQFLP